MTYFILNAIIQPSSNSALMETSECFIFEKMCACLAVLGNIGEYNSPSIVDMIICPLGYFALIIFIKGHTFFIGGQILSRSFPCILNRLLHNFPILFLLYLYIFVSGEILLRTHVF